MLSIIITETENNNTEKENNMTDKKLLEMTTEDKIKELLESKKPSYEIYAQLKVLEKRLAQAEVLEKDIDNKFLLSQRYIELSSIIFKFIRKLP